jgi:hypothetical protein
LSLRIALCLSILLHTVAVGFPLPGGTDPEPPPVRGRERLELRLVDPASALGPESIGDAAAAPAAPGARGGHRSSAAAERFPATGDAVHAKTADPPVATEPVDRFAEPQPATAGAPEPSSAPARDTRRGRGPTLAEMEAELGLDLTDVGDQGQDQIFPVMLKVHLSGGRPTASTYRQLLRTYIDVLMGYPWAVQGALARNADVRFLALLQIEVDAVGSFRVSNLLINENLTDDGGRIEEFYRRLLAEVSRRPFLPPTRAGMDAPALLTFQILNPEATR